MPFEILFWIYLANAVLLINHEIDSAYWKEWELFKLPGGITGFLLMHFPLLFLVLFGFIEVYKQTLAGLIFSLFLSAGGIFAFSIHTYFIKKGSASPADREPGSNKTDRHDEKYSFSNQLLKSNNKKGRHEFNTPISQFILFATLIVSLVQAGMTAYLLISG